MAKQICLMICEAFEREAKAVIEAEGFENIEVIPYPASKLHLRLNWEDIAEKIRTHGAGRQIIFIKGGCLIGLGEPPEELERCYQFSLTQCVDMFLNNSLINSYCSQGAYLLTPSWLKSWREHMEEYGYDKKMAREFFDRSSTKLILLDTGVLENISADLEEFADFLGLPHEVIPVGLDFFTLFLKKIILEWQLNELTNNKNQEKIGIPSSSSEFETKSSIIENNKEEITLLHVTWDDKMGPLLKEFYPKSQPSFPIERVSFQLFSGVESIYGQQRIEGGQGMLLNIENIQKQGYLFFDSIVDMDARGRQRPYMLGVIASKINYFESLRIKEIFKSVSSKLQENLHWNIKNCWEKITRILSTPVL